MPPLAAFGREWEIGSDDLVFPALRSILLRIPWCVANGIVISKHYNLLTEESNIYLEAFLLGSCVNLGLMIFVDLILCVNSSRGSPFEEKRRKFVPICLYIKLFLYCVEIVWNSIGTYGLITDAFNFQANYNSTTDFRMFVKGLIIFNWIMIILLGLFWIWQFDTIGSSAIQNLADLNRSMILDLPIVKRRGQWKRKLRCMFCLVCKEGNSETMQKIYEDAGHSLAYIFANTNLVQSDVVVGAILAIRKTHNIRSVIRYQNLMSNENLIISPILPQFENWNTISEILYTLKYTLSIYTFLGVLAFRKRKIGHALCFNTRCCNFLRGRKKHPLKVEHDNWCQWKSATLSTFVKTEDIVYASYDNFNFNCPFFIALDHSTKKIIISIRGSFSFVDILADIGAVPVNIDVPGVPEHFKAHQSMLLIAKNMAKKIDDLNLFSKLQRTYPSYKFVVTGLSLGAGVATVLSVILHARPQFTDTLKCIAFATPGGSVCKNTAEYCKDFLITVVYGDDFIPRLTIPSLAHAMQHIKQTLEHTKTPKYKVKMGLFCSLLGISLHYKDSDENSLSSISNLSSYDQETNIEIDYEVKPNALERYRHYLPGKILHVTETDYYKVKHKNKSANPRWEIKWTNKEDYNDIIFSKRMGMDHLPFRLMKALKYFSELK